MSLLFGPVPSATLALEGAQEPDAGGHSSLNAFSMRSRVSSMSESWWL